MRVLMSEKPRHHRTLSPLRKLEAIFSKCKPSNGCLIWQGNFFYRKDGSKSYPYLYHAGKVWRGNRLVLFLTSGELPDGKQALHTCDNTKCLNNCHLYWGTPKQNVKDAYDRKRARNAKVTHCPRGHEYVGHNLIIRKNKRYCRNCRDHKNKLRKYEG